MEKEREKCLRYSLIFHWLRAKWEQRKQKMCDREKLEEKNQYFSSIFRMWRLVVSIQKCLSGERTNKCQNSWREYVRNFETEFYVNSFCYCIFYYCRSIRDADKKMVFFPSKYPNFIGKYGVNSEDYSRSILVQFIRIVYDKSNLLCYVASYVHSDIVTCQVLVAFRLCV